MNGVMNGFGRFPTQTRDSKARAKHRQGSTEYAKATKEREDSGGNECPAEPCKDSDGTEQNGDSCQRSCDGCSNNGTSSMSKSILYPQEVAALFRLAEGLSHVERIIDAGADKDN